MGNRFPYACAVMLIALSAPAVAAAAESSSTATASAEASRTYDLDFTLPTAGKSGCMVCHGDPNLVKLSSESTSSIFIDPAVLANTAHADTVCTGCHLDFAYQTPHQNVTAGATWVDVAKSACKNCHSNEFTKSSPGRTPRRVNRGRRTRRSRPSDSPRASPP